MRQGNIELETREETKCCTGNTSEGERHQITVSSNAFIRYHLVIGAGNIKLEQLGKHKRQKKRTGQKPKGKIRSRNFKQEKHGVGTGGR